MLKFNQVSTQFSHTHSSTCNQKIKNFTWEYNTRNNPYTFFIDYDIVKAFGESKKHEKKFLWTLESPKFNGGVFDIIKSNLEKTLETFEMIFTYNEDLLNLNEKFKWLPSMGSWITNPKIYNKTNLISMITSNKVMTPQQLFRVNFANNNKNNIDVFGRGFKEIKNKEEGLENYMFSVCIENDTFDTYFTEKILDCFATGTIPIYKGTKKIINHFNSEGIIFLDDFNIENINEELYFSKIEYVKDNFNRVKQYMLPEDYMFDKYLNEIIL